MTAKHRMIETIVACCAGLAAIATSLVAAPAPGSGPSDKAAKPNQPVFAKPPAPPAKAPPAPAASTTNVGRGFGGTHTNRPFSALGSGRPLAPTGTGRPLAPIGRDRGLAKTGTDRPLAPIGGGGPDAVGPVPTTTPTYPGYHGGGRTFIAVEPLPEPDAGFDLAGATTPESPGSTVDPILPGEPGLEPTAPVDTGPVIDPIKLELAQRLAAEGHVQFLRGEFHLAEASLQSAVDLVPSMDGVRLELAFSLLANGRVNSAAKEFVRAEATDPTLFRSVLDPRAAVGSQQTFDRCREQADRYHAAYPMDSDALFVHALMSWWSGNGREAGIDLAALAGSDPSYGGLKAAFVNPALDEALKPQ